LITFENSCDNIESILPEYHVCKSRLTEAARQHLAGIPAPRPSGPSHFKKLNPRSSDLRASTPSQCHLRSPHGRRPLVARVPGKCAANGRGDRAAGNAHKKGSPGRAAQGQGQAYRAQQDAAAGPRDGAD
ncbi:hypothetical protein V491_01608, partial [Pseudogymnoascus sp. VKM F-3775]